MFIEKEILKEEQGNLDKAQDLLIENQKEVVRLYEIAWQSWDRDPENKDGALSGIMEMYEGIIKNYNRNKDHPYFARIKFCEEGQNVEDFYIGKIGYVELDDKKMLDWRAPISDLYYNSPLGKTSYKTTENDIINGELLLKRQLKIEDSIVKAFFDFNKTISSDELLKPYLTESADNRLKNIVSTIQQEQNEIIRFPLNTNVIVQGVAGSGKTTVALHRLSYLMYNYKDYIKAKEFLIISPNDVFKSYISGLLVDLDAEGAYSYKMQEIFAEYTQIKFAILERNKQYENLLKHKINPEYLSYKSSMNFKEAFDLFWQDFEKSIFCRDLVIDNIKILDKEEVFKIHKKTKLNIFELSFDAFVDKMVFEFSTNASLIESVESQLKLQEIPFKKRLEILNILQRKGLRNILRKFKPVGLNAVNIYKTFINKIEMYSNFVDLQTLKNQTLKSLHNKVLSYEDIFPLIYIQSKLVDNKDFQPIRHVFIDEAQDISDFGFFALREIFKYSNFSIFGDLAQAIYSYQSINSWNYVENLLPDCKYLPLLKSYRTSVEIMEEANKTLLKLGMEKASNVIRHGEKVEIVKGDALQLIKNQIEFAKQKKYKTLAIVCKDKDELEQAKNLLQDLDIFVLDEDNTKYEEKKHILLTVQTAKGLEFDAISIYNQNSYNQNLSLDLKLLFVSKTRALHKLFINILD